MRNDGMNLLVREDESEIRISNMTHENFVTILGLLADHFVIVSKEGCVVNDEIAHKH